MQEGDPWTPSQFPIMRRAGREGEVSVATGEKGIYIYCLFIITNYY